MAPAAPTRPFAGPRRLVLGLYILAAVAYSSMVIFSVFRSVIQHSPGRPAAPAVTRSKAECVEAFNELFQTLLTERQRVQVAAPDLIESQWMLVRLSLLSRKRVLETECDMDKPERAEVARASSLLEAVVDASTIHVVQFSGQLGPLESQLRKALEIGKASP